MLHGSLRAAFISSLVSICLALSLVVLTGYVGQVSLAQMSFAGLSAFELSHLGRRARASRSRSSLLLAALIAVPLGLLIGLPALRLRGVNLAVVTLAAAFAIDALVFNDEGFSGGLRGRDVPSPTLFGLDLGIAKGDAYPRVIFGVFVLVVVCLVGLLVARLRNAPAGRMFIAVRSNERAAARGRASTSRARSCSRSGCRRSSPASAAACSPTSSRRSPSPSFARLHVAEPAGDHLRRRRRADRRRGRGRA